MNEESRELLDAAQIAERLWCGATLDESQFEVLRALGIRRVISVEIFVYYSRATLQRFGIDFLNVPINDNDTPLVDKVIDRIVAAIDEVIVRGESVYLHCTAGWQRSPALAACYLVYKGMTAETALAYVKQRRPVARFYSSHIASVLRYERRLRAEREWARSAGK
jgi:protein-tyrosine phosphatase